MNSAECLREVAIALIYKGNTVEPLLSGYPCGNGKWLLRIYKGLSTLTFPGVYIQGQRIFVESVRNVFVVGETFSI